MTIILEEKEKTHQTPTHPEVREWLATQKSLLADREEDYERAFDTIGELLDDLTDFNMVLEHLSRTYMHFSGGRVSKPNTLPEVVFQIAEELEQSNREADKREALPDHLYDLLESSLSRQAEADREMVAARSRIEDLEKTQAYSVSDLARALKAADDARAAFSRKCEELEEQRNVSRGIFQKMVEETKALELAQTMLIDQLKKNQTFLENSNPKDTGARGQRDDNKTFLEKLGVKNESR